MSANEAGAHPGTPAKAAPPANTSRAQQDCAPTAKSRLWLWFVAAFLIQGVAWTAWIVIASRHKVQEVPLATGTIDK